MNMSDQFSIREPQQTLFSNLSTTTELHGEARVPAVDLKLMMKVEGEFLAEFDPTLRSFLYRKAVKGEGDLVDQSSKEPTILRFPFMGPVRWDQEFEKYTMVIDLGLGDAYSNIQLAEVKMSKFTIEAQHGGTVLVSFSVRAHPDEKQAGRLYEKQAQDIFITLTPPDENQMVIDGTH